MQTDRTATGAKRIKFSDIYAQQCAVQEATIDGKPYLWLGVERDPLNRLRTRMLLDEDMATSLIPLLKHFVETGFLPMGDK